MKYQQLTYYDIKIIWDLEYIYKIPLIVRPLEMA